METGQSVIQQKAPVPATALLLATFLSRLTTGVSDLKDDTRKVC